MNFDAEASFSFKVQFYKSTSDLHDRQIDRHILLSLRVVTITFKYSKLSVFSKQQS